MEKLRGLILVAQAIRSRILPEDKLPQGGWGRFVQRLKAVADIPRPQRSFPDNREEPISLEEERELRRTKERSETQ